jgi:uncharacterized protein YndB with AHSA1/START domain
MTDTTDDWHVYTTYIRSTPQKVWDAITNPEFARQYWGNGNVSDWKVGSDWNHVDATSGQVYLGGKVLESEPPSRLVLSWIDPAHQDDPAYRSRVTFEIDPVGDMVKLYVIHDRLQPGSAMADGIQQGWPRVLSSMKTWLETGTALDTFAGVTRSCGSQAA